MLEAIWAGAQVESVATAAVAWLPQLSQNGVGGVVAVTDAFSAADLHALEAVLATRQDLPALLLVGGRGLAGFEPLLQLTAVTILPEPWTPAALEVVRPVLPEAPAGDPAEEEAATAADIGIPEQVAAQQPESIAEPLPGLEPGHEDQGMPEDGPGIARSPAGAAVPASAHPPWATALSVELRKLREEQGEFRQEWSLLQKQFADVRQHLAAEDTRKAETIQSQMLELARMRNDRGRAEADHAREELLRGIFLHRDKLAYMLKDTLEPAAKSAAAATLRSLDEFLATQGIVRDENPDPKDPQLARVIGSRPRSVMDPPVDRIVRKPAFYRIDQGTRRVLRPAEIETLT